MADKVRYGSADPFKRYEDAAGITPAPTPTPNLTSTPTLTPPVQQTYKPGKLYPLSGIPDILPELLKRAASGSGAFSKAELKQGYRKIGKGK